MGSAVCASSSGLEVRKYHNSILRVLVKSAKLGSTIFELTTAAKLDYPSSHGKIYMPIGATITL